MSQDPEMIVDANRSNTRWVVRPFPAAEGWGAFVLLQQYPIVDDRTAYTAMFHAVLNVLGYAKEGTEPEAFLQMDRLDFRKDIPAVQQHSNILGDYGLGIYPEQGTPTTWSRDEFLAVMPPEKLRPLAFDVMMVDGGPDAVPVIRSRFLGSGAYVEAYCPAGVNLYQQATSQFRPALTSAILRTFPYHAPLLTRGAVEGADAATLDAWSCGAALYLRESIEDGGLLVLQRGDLQPALEEFAKGTLLPPYTDLVVR